MITVDTLTEITLAIVASAEELYVKHVSGEGIPVNYACIFSHGKVEYDELRSAANLMGTVVWETPTGPVYHIRPIMTVAGHLRLLKIRTPDSDRPQRGDADFTLPDYPAFKRRYLGRSGFACIERPEYEMIELSDSSFDVLAYFSHPTLLDVLGLRHMAD